MWVIVMNRQLIIRGVAVSAAAIAASVFAAGQFMGDQSAMAPSGVVSGDASQVRGAGLVGGTSFAAPPQTTPPDGSKSPSLALSENDSAPDQAAAPRGSERATLEFTALDSSQDKAAAPDVQSDISPVLALAEPETPLCASEMIASPAIDGLFELRISAPCNTGERVVVSHGDLAFTSKLDQEGKFSAYLPALSATVAVDAFLSDDTLLQASTEVPDFDQYARMIVQWSGEDTVALHAYHRGAMYGEDGHIHSMNPFDPALEEAFLVSLGDPTALEPMLAQVYSVPLAQATDTRLQLELGTSAQTCGNDLSAYVMSTAGVQAGQPSELRVAMPACSTGDGFVQVDLPFDAATPEADGLEFTADES